ncbi:MAG TPA: cob(I)yrinic acid a,c-diamide adenosyltransferase [Gemmatimonadales bacterium]
MKIYTKTGDGGETSLFGGRRVPKSELRVDAYGAVDELNSQIGVVLATRPVDLAGDVLAAIQRDLFTIGALLASPEPDRVAKALAKAELTQDHVGALERAIDRVEDELPALTSFVIPGGSLKAAHLHVARAGCRRAERAVVALHSTEPVEYLILQYLNRLSDLLFVLARLANLHAGEPDRTW